MQRRGYVQLIDATQWFEPLRRNLGNKNCVLSDEDGGDIDRIMETFLKFEESEESKIFPNEAFGYWKVMVERPLRIEGIEPGRQYKTNEIRELKVSGVRSESAPPVIKRIHRRGVEPDPIRGLFPATIGGRDVVVEYEPDSDSRDTEQIPLVEEGGIEGFLRREVLPYANDAWYVERSLKIGYEISFNRYFYKPAPIRSLNEIREEIAFLEHESEGILIGIAGLGL